MVPGLWRPYGASNNHQIKEGTKMATMIQWEDNIATLSDAELAGVSSALEDLKSWDLFEGEHNYMGTLRAMVNHEETKRLLARHDAQLASVSAFCDKIFKEV